MYGMGWPTVARDMSISIRNIIYEPIQLAVLCDTHIHTRVSRDHINRTRTLIYSGAV
jgi:hypothetical protein